MSINVVLIQLLDPKGRILSIQFISLNQHVNIRNKNQRLYDKVNTTIKSDLSG